MRRLAERDNYTFAICVAVPLLISPLLTRLYPIKLLHKRSTVVTELEDLIGINIVVMERQGELLKAGCMVQG